MVEYSEILLSASNERTQALPLLPRTGWKNQLAFLKATLKAKIALDWIEKEVDDT